MKYFIIHVLPIIFFLCSCETETTDNNKIFDIEQHEFEAIETIIDSTIIFLKNIKSPEKKIIDKMLKSEHFQDGFNLYLEEFYEDKIHTFFFEIDFNNDGEMDIIYQGPSGGESDYVIFYLNKKDEYISFFQDYSHLDKLVFVDSILNMIHINQPGCCADHSFLQKQTHFVYHNGQFHTERIKTICSYGEPELKNRFQTPKDIEINVTPYMLRYSPHIDNDTFFYGSNENEKPDWLIIGNQLGKLKKGDRGKAIAYEKDETGREWWLVILNKEVRPTDNYFDYIITPENENLQFSGWVSKKNVIVLEE